VYEAITTGKTWVGQAAEGEGDKGLHGVGWGWYWGRATLHHTTQPRGMNGIVSVLYAASPHQQGAAGNDRRQVCGCLRDRTPGWHTARVDEAQGPGPRQLGALGDRLRGQVVKAVRGRDGRTREPNLVLRAEFACMRAGQTLP